MRYLNTLRASATRLALLALLLAGLTMAAPTTAAPVRQDEPQIGTVGAIGLDDNGDGWAWAYPAPQTFATSFLVRIENGAWRVAADGSSDPALLPPGLAIHRIALTGAGTDGWAIGSDPDNQDERPVFWRLDNGAWRPAQHSLGPTIRMLDLAINADGTDGWIVVFDLAESSFSLLRLVNGAWGLAPNPDGGDIRRVAISPDGNSAWGVGVRFSDGAQMAYRRVDGNWIEGHNLPYDGDDVPLRITADNAGNSWILADVGIEGDAALALGQSSPSTFNLQPSTLNSALSAPSSAELFVRSNLLRLEPGAEPRLVDLAVQAPEAEGDVIFSLHDLVVDGSGVGWAAGAYFLGTREQPGAIEDIVEPALVYIHAGNAALIDPRYAGLPTDQNLHPLVLDNSPDGGHIWTAGRTGVGLGFLQQLHYPWANEQPPATDPLPGPTLCWEETDHCLRGVFARYWQEHGGLDNFGYPVTPEVLETIGGKEYLVQYTQRARFEHHPEYAGTPNEVLLGLLGNQLVADRLDEEPFTPKEPSGCAGCRWFMETGHNVGAPILPYWENNGGIAVFGLPRSEAFEETNAADGKVYLVQYFERNRIEYHPENAGTPFEFQLGLLGVEQFMKTYGYLP